MDDERRTLDEQIRTAEPAAAATREVLRDARHELSAAQRDLAEVTAAAGAAGAAAVQLWGREAMALRQEVDRALQRQDRGGFSAPPIGPIGMYLRSTTGVSDGEARVVETALAGVMDAWVVNTRADMERLWDIAKRVGGGGRARRGAWPPQVFISGFRSHVYDYGPVRAVDGQGRVWRRLIDMVRVEGLDQQVRGVGVILGPLTHGALRADGLAGEDCAPVMAYLATGLQSRCGGGWRYRAG